MAIPKQLLLFLKHLLCCLGLYILLGALLMGICILLRLYCTQINSFLDFLFVTGGGGGLFPFLSTTAENITTFWNSIAPAASTGLSTILDLEINIFVQLVDEFGEYQVETMIYNLLQQCSESISFLGQWMITILEQQSKLPLKTELMSEVVSWQMGNGLITLLPLLQASQTLLLNPSGLKNPPVTNNPFVQQRKLLDFDPLTQSPAYDVTAVEFIHTLQQETRNLWSSSYGLSGPEYNLSSSIALAEKLLQAYHSYPYNNNPDTLRNTVNMENLRNLENNKIIWNIFYNNTVQYFRIYLQQINLITNTTSPIGTEATALLASRIVSFNKNFRNKYGSGRAFVYSLDMHDLLGIKKSSHTALSERLTFSEFLKIHDLTPRQAAELQTSELASSGTPQSNPTQRRLLQVFPPVIPPFVNCFDTIPPDPLCIIQNLFPLPLPTNPFIDMLLAFNCDCTDEGFIDVPLFNYFTANGLWNAILVIQTGIQALTAIPPIFEFFDVILPDWLNTWFFGAFIPDAIWNALLIDGISGLGVLPDQHQLICAVLHVDYLLMLIFVGFVALFIILAIWGVIWDVYSNLQDLRIRREHSLLVEKILNSEMRGYDFDNKLKSEMAYTMFNPAVRYFNNPNIFRNHSVLPLIGASINSQNSEMPISKGIEDVSKLSKEITAKATAKVMSTTEKCERKLKEKQIRRMFYPEIQYRKKFLLAHNINPEKETDIEFFVNECKKWLGEPFNIYTLPEKLREAAIQDSSVYILIDQIRSECVN